MQSSEELELRRRARLASFPELNPNPVLEMDFSGRVSYANPASRDLFPDLQEQGLLHPYLNGLQEILMDCAGGVRNCLREVSVSGTWYQQSIYCVATEKVCRIYGINITDRKRTEEELKRLNAELENRVRERTIELSRANQLLKSEIEERRQMEDNVQKERQRLYDVLETLPVYVVLLTPEYHVVFANRFFRERFGESNGRRCHEYLFERAAPCDVCETFTVLQTSAPHHWEWRGPDGRIYDIHDFPLKAVDGTVQILEMGIDITARKKAEEELRVYSRNLIDIEETMRKNLAGELHDRLGQAIASISLNFSLITGGLSSESITRLGPRIEDTGDLIRDVGSALRDVMTELRPPDM